MEKYDYKNICPFKWFVLENFPFIEDDFDALTNWQLFCKIGKEINKIIASQNEVGQAVEDFTEKFIALYNYVHDYFDNLDVQDEINNKLDAMVEDGTLESILNNYVKIQKIYPTTTDLLEATDLVDGMKVKTLGYYNINDGGGADFIITDTESATDYQLTIGSLYATMLIDNEKINIRQLGAKTYQEDNNFDNKNIIDIYLSICNKSDTTYELYIPQGHWCFSETLFNRAHGVRITGDKTWAYDNIYGTTIHPFRENQQYIWKIGGKADAANNDQLTVTQMVKSSRVDGICFTTYNGDSSLYWGVDYGVFIIDSTIFSNFDNLHFWHIKGNGLCMKSCWEIQFGQVSIRQHVNPTTYSIYFMRTRPISNVSPNLSAITFENIYLERNDGYIYSAPGSGFSHNCIKHLNIEMRFSSTTSFNTSEITDENIDEYYPIDVIRGYCREFIIGDFNVIYNSSSTGIIYNSNKYYLRSLLCDNMSLTSGISDNDRRFNIDVGVLSCTYGQSSSLCSIIYSRDMFHQSHINIGCLNISINNPKYIINAFQSGNIRIGNTTTSSPAYNTTNGVAQKEYIDAWKHPTVVTASGVRLPVSTAFNGGCGTEFNLIVDKDPTTQSGQTAGCRFTYPYLQNDSEHTKTLKIFVQNKTPDQTHTMQVIAVHNGSNYTYNATVAATDAWQEISIPNFYSDFNSAINIYTRGYYRIGKFKFE